jgi:hypothetical protein
MACNFLNYSFKKKKKTELKGRFEKSKFHYLIELRNLQKEGNQFRVKLIRLFK